MLFASFSKQQNSMMVVLIPFFGAIPAIIGALLLFVPAEYYLDHIGQSALKNIAIPVIGGTLVFFVTLAIAQKGEISSLTDRLSKGKWNDWAGFVFWVLMGAIWGVLWRLTEWLVELSGAIGS
ncbi:MAG: hypothetical protein AAFX04_06230 [Pseudomonadota bacterium]